MAGGHPVSLKRGLPFEGKDNQKVAELQESNAGMILDARQASERVVTIKAGKDGKEQIPVIVASPATVRMELVRRLIVRIGEIPGNPLSEELYRKLSGVDLAIIEAHIEKMDSAALQEVGLGGRDPEEG